MDVYLILVIIVAVVGLVIITIFRRKYGTLSAVKIREKNANIPADNPDEVNRREKFREELKNFLPKG